MPTKSVPPEQRFWPKVNKGDVCWNWMASRLPAGYGRFFDGLRQVYAHRFAYELLVGPIPDGLHLDHLCRNTRCVNPDHLEPVTNRENALRGNSPMAHKARKTHCVNGHEFTPENTWYRPDRPNQRACRTCNRLQARAVRKRRTLMRRALRSDLSDKGGYSREVRDQLGM